MPNEQDKTLFKRLSSTEEQGRNKGSTKLIEASCIVTGCHRTSTTNQGSEPVNRKERAILNDRIRKDEELVLEEWAKQNGCWEDREHFESKFIDRKIGGGAEAAVYLSFDGNDVVKVNDASYHGNWLEFFDRLAIHNTLFPETYYSLIGFTQRVGFHGENRFAAIVKQVFVKTIRGACFDEVKINMQLMGFSHLRRDDYYNPETGVIIEDLHDENVFIDENNILIYIDPAIFLEQPEMNLAGKRIIRF